MGNWQAYDIDEQLKHDKEKVKIVMDIVKQKS
jgi:hypothetical protein